MNRYRTLGYSLLGGGGALGSLLVSRGCVGHCAACYSCLALPGLIVGVALVKSLKPEKKGDAYGLAAGDH